METLSRPVPLPIQRVVARKDVRYQQRLIVVDRRKEINYLRLLLNEVEGSEAKPE